METPNLATSQQLTRLVQMLTTAPLEIPKNPKDKLSILWIQEFTQMISRRMREDFTESEAENLLMDLEGSSQFSSQESFILLMPIYVDYVMRAGEHWGICRLTNQILQYIDTSISFSAGFADLKDGQVEEIIKGYNDNKLATI